MSFLTDAEILDLIKHNELKLEPYDSRNIFSTFVELKLGNKFTTIVNTSKAYINSIHLDNQFEKELASKQKYSTINVDDGDTYMIAPGEFVLGITKEKITMPKNHIAALHGRNRLGQLGIQVLCSGGYVNPGFSGHLILEMYNVNKVPVMLKSGMRIAKLTFEKLNNVPKMIKFGGFG